jgi:hypothetical protein
MKTSIAIGALALAALAGSANAQFTMANWRANPIQNVGVFTITLDASSTLANTVEIGFVDLGSPFDRFQVVPSRSLSAGIPNGTLNYTLSLNATAVSSGMYFYHASIDSNEIGTISLTTTIVEPNPDVLLFSSGSLVQAPVPGFFTSLTVTNTLNNDPLTTVQNSFNNTFFWRIPTPGSAAVLGLGGLLAARRRR